MNWFTSLRDKVERVVVVYYYYYSTTTILLLNYYYNVFYVLEWGGTTPLVHYE